MDMKKEDCPPSKGNLIRYFLLDVMNMDRFAEKTNNVDNNVYCNSRHATCNS